MATDSVDTAQIITEAVHRNEILEVGNNILNPNFRKGRHFWWDAGAAADYDIGDPDVGFTKSVNAGIGFFPDGLTVGTGAIRGSFFKLDATITGGWAGIISERIAVGALKPIVLSAMTALNGRTIGSGVITIGCYSVAGLYLGGVANITLVEDKVWSLSESTANILANTVYCRILIIGDTNFNATNFLVTNLQLESGAVASPYADDMSIGQGVSAAYGKTATQLIPDSAWTPVNFESEIYDDPGANRVAVGGAWKFTANRYMKLHVSAKTVYDSTALVAGRLARLAIYITPSGGASIQYELIGSWYAQTAGNMIFDVQGSIDFELNEGDAFHIGAFQFSGVALDIVGSGSYITIHEIL